MANITADTGFDLVDENGRPIADENQPPRSSSADYADILMALLPSGAVWPRDTSSAVSQAMGAIAPTFSRCDARAVNVLAESPVGGVFVEMLPEWEAAFGLPDACSGPDPTIALRQAHVRASLAYSGGQSVPYFIGFAAALGYNITIQEFTPSRFGRAFGLPFGGEDWAYTWRIVAPATVITPFQFGLGRFGDPFRSFGSKTLQCTFGRIKPAHTILQVAYSGDAPDFSAADFSSDFAIGN